MELRVVIIMGGGVLFLVSLFFSFVVGLCGIGSIGSVGTCTRTQKTEVLMGAVAALLAFLGAPALASICTRRWWWSVLPLLITIAFWAFEYHNNPAATSSLREVGELVLMSAAEACLVGVVVLILRVKEARASSHPA